MGKHEKLLNQILRGNADQNIDFQQMISLLKSRGFVERVKGSHHILHRENVEEILNLQPRGSHAKPYQVNQVRTVIVKYGLAGEP